MNATVPAVRPPLQAGGAVAALVPQTMEEAFRVAQAIAASGLAPRGLEKPEQVLIAIMAGAELGFAPFQSLQSFAVVNGRPTLWGDGLVAIVRRNGCSIREWHEGETAFCEVTRPDTGEIIVRSFSQAEAIKAGLAGKQGPWQQYPARMRAMRARAWSVRDGCADMLRGFQVAEEVADYQEVRDVTPKTTGMRARLEARAAGSDGFNADHVARETAAATGHDEDGVVDESITDAEILNEAEAADPFPGDKPREAAQEPATATEGARPASQVLTTVKSRVDAFKAHCLKTPNVAALQAIWPLPHTKVLLKDIDAGDPEEVGTSGELQAWFDGEVERRTEEANSARDGAQ